MKRIDAVFFLSFLCKDNSRSQKPHGNRTTSSLVWDLIGPKFRLIFSRVRLELPVMINATGI